MTWKIQAITGDLTGQEISIERDMLVGRHQNADIVLQAAEISRKHAAFLLKDQALWLQDLQSSNGTFVNDQRLAEQEALIKEGDIIQFASLKFSVLAPAVNVIENEIVQPAEAVAVAEISTPKEATQSDADKTDAAVEKLTTESAVETARASTEVIEPSPVEPVVQPEVKTAAQEMNEQGMPSLTERANSIQVDRNGMPKSVGVPKPAPIPEGIDLTPKAPVVSTADVEIPAVCESREAETQKNASVGLISLVVLIVLAIVAWLFFK